MPYPYTPDSFFFINGSFILNDRFTGWNDTTSTLFDRNSSLKELNDLFVDTLKFPIDQFHPCSTLKASSIKFEDLNIKIGEFCLFRHFCDCDHYFIFSSIYTITCPPDISQYPFSSNNIETNNDLLNQKIASVIRFPYVLNSCTEKALLCQICKKIPSTIAVYNDLNCPTSPTAFCLNCYTIFYGTTPNKVSYSEESTVFTLELPIDKFCYFTSSD